jgi:MSHA biogenesis protein MshO
MRRAMQPRVQRGFTLVEAVVVIVIIGILSAVVAVFIRTPVQGYVDSAGRAEVADEADLALRRTARDLRLALPNSIRQSASGDAVEFLETKSGGRYLSADDGLADGTTLFALDFVDPSKMTFSVVGAMKSLGDRLAPGDYVVVYNLGPGYGPADAYTGGNIAQVGGSVSSGGYVTRITLNSNPFASQDPPMPSPTQRFQLVSGPVMYYCNSQSGTMSRYWGYAITPTMTVPPGDPFVRSAVIADHVADCSHVFNYSVTGQRTGLVILSFALKARNDSDPSIKLVHQVHVDNTP